MTKIISQWKRTVNALKDVFFWRSFQDAEIDGILRESMIRLSNFSREPSAADRYGMTIQKFAKRLQDYLQNHHAWHDPGIVECTCCQHPKLHGLQQAVMYQLDVLCKVVIPWQYLLHEPYCR
jgi:hypothetical protein